MDAHMDDSEKPSLTAICDTAAGLSDPVRTGLTKAISSMFGGLKSVPSALMRRPVQAIEDTTAGRSIVSTAIAQAVAEKAVNDPRLMQAAEEIYLPSAIRKVRNRALVAERAVEHARESDSDSVAAGAPDEDWLNVFTRFAEDASSEKLQDLFGRILAGQVLRPGSFSLTTLRTVAELDQSVAHDFSVVWAKSVGEAVDYTKEFKCGEWFSRWQRLIEAGLMLPSESAQFLPPYKPVVGTNSLWCPITAGGNSLIVQFSKDCNARWTYIAFTRVGLQLGSILPTPFYAENIRAVGQKLKDPGIVCVELWMSDKRKELIYSSDAK